MKKTYSYIAYISLLINLLLLVWYFIPKTQFISNSREARHSSKDSFSVWWFVNPINFEAWEKMYEAYIIHWVIDYKNNKMSYYFTDLLCLRWWLANWLSATSLQKLLVRRDNDEELVLYDDIYEFTINKKTSSIIWKDKGWHIFTLWFHKYIWF